LRAHGRVGQAQIAHGGAFATANTKKHPPAEKRPPMAVKSLVARGGVRAGKNSLPPTPFLFARPASPIIGGKLSVFFVKISSNFFVNTARNGKLGFFRQNSPRFFPQPPHFLPREAEVRHAKRACLRAQPIFKTTIFVQKR